MRTTRLILITVAAVIVLLLGVSAVVAAPGGGADRWGHDEMHAQMRSQMADHMSADAVAECERMHARMRGPGPETRADGVSGTPGGMMGGGG